VLFLRCGKGYYRVEQVKIMKSSTMRHHFADDVAATAIEKGVAAAVASVVAICAISATGDSLFTFLGTTGKWLFHLIGG
jgi:Flp pilus assembly pilin Flp